MEVMSIAAAAEKFARRGGMAGNDYKIGVEGTKKNQAELAIAAEPIYESQLTASFGRKAFSKGLRKSGHAKWRANAGGKGARNYPMAVAEAGPEYARSVAPFFRALEALDLGPKAPRASPQAFERSKKVGMALNAVRLAL